MKNLKALSIFVCALALVLALGQAPAFAQATTNSTTLSAPVGVSDQFVNVTSATNMTAPGSLANQYNTYLVIDGEAMAVTSISGTYIGVRRGYPSGGIGAHANGATIWFGPANYFLQAAPSGSCVAGNIVALPAVLIPGGPGSANGGSTGDLFDCINIPGQTTSATTQWVQRAAGKPLAHADGEFDIAPANCAPSVSDHAGTLGITVTGASNVYAMQAATSSSATTNTLTFTCPITVPFRTNAAKGILITSVVADYGVQTTALGTQVNTLASGTYNGSLVFSKIVLPAAGASETASTVTPVRWDSGTLAVSPAAASANVALTTAGAFYTIKFTPSAPLTVADLTKYLFTLSLQGGASPGTATVANLLGVHVYFTEVSY